MGKNELNATNTAADASQRQAEAELGVSCFFTMFLLNKEAKLYMIEQQIKM